VKSDKDSSKEQGFVPPAPQDMAETGLAESLVEDLILKTIYARGEIVGRDLAAAVWAAVQSD
jgi:hypothetical protein